MNYLSQLITKITGKEQIDVADSWQTDIDDDFPFEINALKFVFSQAEKKLEDSNKVFDATSAKSVSLIALASGIFIAQATYFFLNNYIGKDAELDPKLFTVFVSAMFVLLILSYLLNNLIPVNYHTVGSSPKRLFNKSFFNEQFAGKSENFLYANEIETYEIKIDYNFKLNSIRLQRVRFGIRALLFLPVVALSLFYPTAIFLAFLL